MPSTCTGKDSATLSSGEGDTAERTKERGGSKTSSGKVVPSYQGAGTVVQKRVHQNSYGVAYSHRDVIHVHPI